MSEQRRRRYAVVGTGAVGGYYGARLAASGHDVHFVARTDLDHLRAHGLRVESPEGDLELPDVHAHGSTTEVPEVDVVLLATKALDNLEAAELLGPVVGPATIVVALQNGLGVEAPLAAAFPDNPVLGGMCFVCVNKVGPGHVRHLDYGLVTVAEHRPDGPAGITPSVEAVAGDLDRAGVPSRMIEDLGTGRWRKLVWNIPYNGLSVVLDAGTDALMANPATRAAVEELMREVVAAADACGHPIDAGFVQTMLEDTEKMLPYATSMKLDYEAGRPLELDAIYRTPIATAAIAGVDMVRTRLLTAELDLLDRRNRGH